MSTRRQGQNRVKSVPVSATLNRELHDFIEDLIDRRMVANRSHALNLGLECLQWMLANNPTWFLGDRTAPNPRTKPASRIAQPPQPQHLPQPDTDPYYPR